MTTTLLKGARNPIAAFHNDVNGKIIINSASTEDIFFLYMSRLMFAVLRNLFNTVSTLNIKTCNTSHKITQL